MNLKKMICFLVALCLLTGCAVKPLILKSDIYADMMKTWSFQNMDFNKLKLAMLRTKLTGQNLIMFQHLYNVNPIENEFDDIKLNVILLNTESKYRYFFFNIVGFPCAQVVFILDEEEVFIDNFLFMHIGTPLEDFNYGN